MKSPSMRPRPRNEANAEAPPVAEAAPGHNRPPGPIQLDPASFPDRHGNGAVPTTIANVLHLLSENGIKVRHNQISKRTEIEVPWRRKRMSSGLTQVMSLAALNGMSTGNIQPILEEIGEDNTYNPARDWIESEVWDGKDRLQSVCDTITPRKGYSLELRDVLIKKWLLSVAAAAIMPNFRTRGVLTLQGKQGIGKTSWGLSLINDFSLRKELIKVDHHLDPGNKDSQLGAITHWIVEIGELDSSLRRDVSRIKGFLSSPTDKIRKPYGREPTEYSRRTVFYATVNASDFLVDETGNSRWWTIPCESLNHAHGIDMQQVFAQCADQLANGAIWWLTPEEEALLEAHNSQHRTTSVVRDRVLAAIDVEATGRKNMTATEVLELAGFERPTNSQAKECAALLRERFGDSKRVNGRDRWSIPVREALRASPLPPPVKSKFD